MARGREGAAIVAKQAWGAFGKEVTPEIIDGFYAALRGKPFKAAMRAVARCMKHPNRIYPPSGSEVLGEILIEEHEAARTRSNERVRNLSESRPVSDELLLKQMQEARRDYPHLYADGDDSPLVILEKRLLEKMRERARPNEFAAPAYNPGDDLDAPF